MPRANRRPGCGYRFLFRTPGSRRYRRVLVPVLSAALLVGGCCHNAHSHGGKLIVQHEPDSSCAEANTPYKAMYALYHWDKPPDPPPQTWVPDQQVTQMFVRGLARDEKIGFKKGPNGELLAVAGPETIKLEDGRYCWHITGDREYTGGQRLVHEMGETATSIVALPCGTVLFIASLPVLAVFFVGWGAFALGVAACGG